MKDLMKSAPSKQERR